MTSNEKQAISILVVQEPEAIDQPLPSYATVGSAGVDLLANIPEDQTLSIGCGERRLVSTGLRFAIPEGYEAQVRSRSGLALKHGVVVLNSPGTIDSDYRGVVQVMLINHGQEPFEIRRGDRIAQMVIAPVSHASWILTESLDETVRGDGGFGSTGKKV